jgi:DNA invertase Pin-like site-specific DNA recombinase
MTTYFYIRVSTSLQTCENQRFELDNYAAQHGIKPDECVEETISSRKPLEQRKLGKLLKKLGPNDVILATEISRLGRNMLEVMGILQQCLEKGCEIITVKENYHLGSDIQSKVLAFAFGLSAEIERNLISQRTKEALLRIKAEGKILGRPLGKKSSVVKLTGQEHKVQKLLAQKVSKSAIARMLGVHRTTVAKFINERIVATNLVITKSR